MTQNMTAYYVIKAMAHYEKETLIARLSYILTENQLNRLTNGIATKIELVDPVKFAEYMEEVGIFDATFCGGTFITSISDTNDSPIGFYANVSGKDKDGNVISRALDYQFDQPIAKCFDFGFI